MSVNNYTRVGIFSKEDVENIINIINSNSDNNGFGVRFFLLKNHEIFEYLKSHNRFRKLLYTFFTEPTIIKSIFFDKPPNANWAVNWHQDLTINLKSRIEKEGFLNWRVLEDRVVVQPSLEVLTSITTFRIHLDDTTTQNGCLSIVENSEEGGIIRPNREYIEMNDSRISRVEVNRGGIMIMNPLTVHSSKRSKMDVSKRRVIHLEILEKDRSLELPFLERLSLS